MKRQKGLGVVAYLLAGALGLGALFALWWAVERHGYTRGQTEERALWQARESAELAAANAEIERLHREARAAEHRAAEAMTRLALDYQEALTHAKRESASVITDLRAGRLRLRDRQAPAGESACAGGSTAPAAAAGGGDDRARGELSRSTAAALAELAAEADDVARQLAAAQGVIRSYYAACGPKDALSMQRTGGDGSPRSPAERAPREGSESPARTPAARDGRIAG